MRLPRSLLLGGICALLLGGPASATAKPGDVFVTDSSAFALAGAVFKVGPEGGPPATLKSGAPLNAPSDLVIDRQGRLLVADYFAEAILEVDRETGATVPFLQSPQMPEPTALALAPDDQLYVADGQGPSVLRVDLRTKAITLLPDTVGADWTAAYDMTAARDGTLFLTDGGGEVFVRPPGGPVTKLYEGPLLTNADGLALSADERFLFVANGISGSIVRIDLRTGSVSPYAQAGRGDGLALLHDGGLLVASDKKLERVGPGGSPVSTFSSSDDYASPGSIAIEPPRCRGQLATVVGTTGPDSLDGTPGLDVIEGLAGDDLIRALGGNDVVCGGPGSDRLFGGAGRDVLVGGPGGDRLFGGPGNDRLLGGPGSDRLFGGPGNDRLVGGPGRDRLFGGPGRDLLVGGPGRDRLFGGAGNDVIRARDGVRDLVDCGPGRRDIAIVDRRDVVRNCEIVRRPGGRPRR